MVTVPSYAIRNSRYGPAFGRRRSDIHIVVNANSIGYSSSFFGGSYSVPSGVKSRFTILAGTWYFAPNEVEVFYLD